MSDIATTKKFTAAVKLNGGTSASGVQKYKSVTIGVLNPTNATPTRILDVSALLAPCLDSAVLLVEQTEVKTLVREQ